MNNYSVFITPLSGPNTYGPELNMSEFIGFDGLSGIKREVDDGDYEVGVFTYGHLVLVGENAAGKFNAPGDWRTIFKYSRDLAKVRVKFTDGNSATSVVFKGIINDDGTETSLESDQVELTVTALDSVIRKTTVSAGAISDGTTLSAAIKGVLNVPKITSVLNYSPGNVNVGVDVAIDDASAFDEVPSKDVMDLLLAASNSIMYVDSNDNIIVRSRSLAATSPDLTLYSGDRYGRDNITSLNAYNSGLQRTFNIIKVGATTKKQTNYIEVFEARQKDFTFDFITDSAKENTIAAAVLDELKAPKIELKATVSTDVADGLELYDQAQLIQSPKYTPAGGDSKLPMYGAHKYGEKVYPFEQIGAKLPKSVAYKIIGITENPTRFETVLKLRQIGTSVSDGYY